MHHFRPAPPYFAGDCMPFYHDGVYHLYYLLDENHHQGLGGLGGHQWAHASTTDLIHWQHHPLALAIEADWEASICTGSTFWHAGRYYAFYATRKPDWTQHLCMAVSADGIHFVKSAGNPFLSAPPGYSPFDLRDPFVFADGAGGFGMLVTSRLDPYPLDGRGGCLLLLRSADLQTWTVEGPLLIPGGGPSYLSVPECPDTFAWNGWHYLIFSLGLQTHYCMARSPFGPWEKPAVDLLDSPLAAVMKTAPFHGSRRIGAAFVGTRQGDRDAAPVQWAGNIIFRELVQRADGTLGTRFVPEMTSSLLPGGLTALTLDRLTDGVSGDGRQIRLFAPESLAAAALDGLPRDFYLKCRVAPRAGRARFGLGLRGSGRFGGSHYELAFEPALRRASLADQVIFEVTPLAAPFDLEVICRGDILEACIAGERCIVNRLPEQQGERLFLFCECGEVEYEILRAMGIPAS